MQKFKRTISTIAFFMCSTVVHAWSPSVSVQEADQLIDSAFNRTPAMATSAVLELKGDLLKKVDMYRGAVGCLSAWQQKPTDYSQGSRPEKLTLSGQADEVLYQARQIRDTFETPEPQILLDQVRKNFSNGTLLVLVKVNGLKEQRLRDAYMVGAMFENQVLRPNLNIAFDDWQKTDAGLYAGTLAYYFDFSAYKVVDASKIVLLVRTEAKNNCVYRIPLDLSTFK